MDWTKIRLRQHEGIKIYEESSKPLVQINYEIDQDYN